nr:MAG TPA: hypothetical protein [Caudoviricetes sp.]
MSFSSFNVLQFLKYFIIALLFINVFRLSLLEL